MFVGLRLIDHMEVAIVQRLAKLGLDLAPHPHRGVHLGLEEAVLRAAVVLGTVEREVGMAQGVLPIQRVGGVDLVLPNAAGLSLVAPGHGGLLPGRPALASPRALDDVLDEIRALVVEVHGAH